MLALFVFPFCVADVQTTAITTDVPDALATTDTSDGVLMTSSF